MKSQINSVMQLGTESKVREFSYDVKMISMISLIIIFFVFVVFGNIIYKFLEKINENILL